jgi:hypothetical protein
MTYEPEGEKIKCIAIVRTDCYNEVEKGKH